VCLATVDAMEASAFALEQETDRLVTEIQRYLAVIDALRSEGLEPSWIPESPMVALEQEE
jgi:hypothetical protein